ncbi:centromere protein C 1 [Zea mays]|uniref:Centromere protein C 1 n=1 Tax=Zea mays TaxID=4577 RepID=A0A1D6NJN7_MAIZE|nr:centromere protein C 1 [Zea mays]
MFVEVCSIYFFSTDKSSQLLEMPQEDINPLNQAQMHGGSTKKSAPDLSPTKQKKQQAVQERKRKQQSKRGKKVAGITSSNSTLYLYFVTPSDSMYTWLVNINIV